MSLSSISTRTIVISVFVFMFLGLSLAWWGRYSMVTSVGEKDEALKGSSSIVITEKDGQNSITLQGAENRHYTLVAPGVLKAVKAKGEVVALTHYVPYDHVDPCDFVGDRGRLSQVNDVNIEIGMGGSLRETMKHFGGAYIVNEFFPVGASSPKLEGGFIEAIDIVGRKGYAVTSQVEGCGNVTYYFPQGKDTLVFKRKIITQLQPIYTNYTKVRGLPGVIRSDAEEELFRSIIASITIQ